MVQIETHWEDLLNLLRLLRDENIEENAKLIRLALTTGFTKFLKVPPALSEEILHQIL